MSVLLVLAACSPSPNYAGLKMEPRRATYRERVLMKTLPNGLKVVMLPDNRSNLVMVAVRYAVGASDDPSGADGLAHYVEHVMFDAAFRGPGADALRDVGLYANASTSLDRTYFYLKALDVELAQALELTARRFEATCDDLDAATLARERDVVIEEEKWRSAQPDIGVLYKAIWGAAHPYGHDPGGHGFAGLERAALCKFVEENYGPSSAVLVVTGNVHDDDFQRIVRRFERIPARKAASRVAQTAPPKTSRVVMPGIKRPTAVLTFPAPGEGSDSDAALDALDGHAWRLEGDTPAPFATIRVFGEQRERAVVAFAEVDDAKKLDELSAAMVRTFGKAKVGSLDLELYKLHRRTVLSSELDDPFVAIEAIAAQVARGERPTRFRALQQLDRLEVTDLTKFFGAPLVRVAYLLPQVGVKGAHPLSSVATSLHDLDTPRGPVPASMLAPAQAARPHVPVVEQQLRNGLRVLLAPDPSALAMDARLVITGTRDETVSGIDEQAARYLSPEAWPISVAERLQWYQLVAAPVVGRAGVDTTIFQISGLTLYADWHVWHLALTVLRGTYPERLIEIDRRSASREQTRPPSPFEVVMHRVAGVERPADKPTIHSKDTLQAFRHARYRPERSTLIVTGNFDVARMQKEIETLFSEWEPVASEAAYAPPISKSPLVGTAVGIEADDQPTLDITIAFAPAKRASPSEAVARSVLHAMLDNRLRVVRERLGASYGVRAAVGRVMIYIDGSVEPAYAAEAAKAIADELERIRNGDASLSDDFMRAKKTVLATALASPASASSRASALATVVLDEGDIKQLESQPDAIRALDLRAIQAIAARDMAPKRMITAARGDKRAVEAALAALGAPKDAIEWLSPRGGNGRDRRKPAETPKLTIRDR